MKTYFFDHHGLRFSSSYLNHMLPRIWRLTIEEQSEFVDGITYARCKQGIPLFRGDEDINPDEINTTSVGNLAYAIINHPLKSQQDLGISLYKKLKPT